MTQAESQVNWWTKITLATEKAMAVNALYSIPTKSEIVHQGGIDFLVRIVDNLARKENQKKKQNKKQKKDQNFNPFLPYEDNLFIDNINDDYVAILNKFNVVDYHLLIITREFVPQNEVLLIDDFLALWTILSEVDGLAFFNSGKLAGASQPHKHLQLVPYPLSEIIEKAPIHNLILAHENQEQIVSLKQLPFSHSIAFFEPEVKLSIKQLAQKTWQYYHQLLEAVKIKLKQKKPQEDYNLLITREWMMLIPRTKDSFDNLSINSLGFAGALLVKNQTDLAKVKQYQPLEILAQVAK